MCTACAILHSLGECWHNGCAELSLGNAHTHLLESCILSAAAQAIDGLLPGQLVSSHSRITDALAAMSHADPSTPTFDLAVLEVVQALEGHSKVGSELLKHASSVGP
jgi:hypothetical protein